MNFLNPFFLVFLAAAAVPLVIHLFSRRKIPEVPFSTLRFIQGSDRRSMRRINLRRLLLLALRMAAIALIALAFARPVITGSLAALFPGEGPRAVCILLDRSYSMAAGEPDGTVFERARKNVERITAGLDEEDEVSILLFDTRRERVFEGGKFESGRALELLGPAETSYYGTDLAGAVDEAFEILRQSRIEEREMYIVSDFQRCASGRGGTGSGDIPVRTFVIPVQPDPAANVSIESVLTPRVAVHRGETVEIAATLVNHSGEFQARFPLRISLDGKLVMEREVVLGPGVSRTERMEIPIERSGWISGEVAKKFDRLPSDDTRYFCLFARERVNVLLLKGDENSFWLQQALSPEGTEGDILLRTKGWGEYVTADLNRADVVVVGSGRGPRGSDIDLLGQFASRGGRVVVFVTEGSGETIEKLGGGKARMILEESNVMRGGLYPGGKTIALLSPFDREDMEGLSRAVFVGSPAVRGVPEEEILISFRDGTPFMWKTDRGGGEVIFAAFDPSPAGGDFVLSPLFLPLVRQMVTWTDNDAVFAGGAFVGGEAVWEGEAGVEYTVILPGGSRLKPADAGKIVIPAGDLPGFADLAGGSETVFRMAVNPDCRVESRTDYMSAREAIDSLGLKNAAAAEAGERLDEEIRTAREGREISTPLAFAAILVLAVELLIAQRREMAVEG